MIEALERIERQGGPLATILAGGTYAQAVGVTPAELEAIYALGYGEYQNGRFADAERTFRLLCIHDHRAERHWLALGSARQQLKDFAGAVHAYSMGVEAGSTNPLLPLQGAECYFALGLFGEALQALQLALEWSDTAANPQAIVDRVQLLFDTFEKLEAPAAARQGDA